jgi:predicted 2-oxoglutarate/Fe(II)-dependent dioxygenase YbiX
MIESIDEGTFVTYKDEPNTKGELGITQNRIVEIPNFVTPEEAQSMIDYFESKAEMWGDIAFYGSSGMGIMQDDEDTKTFGLYPTFFQELTQKYKEAVEIVFGRLVKPNTSHAQKWDVGGFASPHSDNSDFDGNPTSFQINKYVGILYLNDNYDGGNLYFPDHEIDFKPAAYSFITFPGGIENVHGVSEITSGTRYTMVSFWDFEESEYSEELQEQWAEELKQVRAEQAKQKEEWEKGNKFA